MIISRLVERMVKEAGIPAEPLPALRVNRRRVGYVTASAEGCM